MRQPPENMATGLYLGMFSVSPDEQGTGIGKKILLASEQHANERRMQEYIICRVMSVREE